MSATNSTPTINLPLFIGTDKPAWLVDWNGAMNSIDSAIAALQTAESGTASALSALSSSVNALSNTVSQQTTAIETVTQSVNQLAGNVTTINGNINTINSLIGNGEPTTTDKTIIGAINEINAKIPEGGEVAADDVTYDNTSSGLTATDVQSAIDELAQGGSGIQTATFTGTTTAGGVLLTNTAEDVGGKTKVVVAARALVTNRFASVDWIQKDTDGNMRFIISDATTHTVVNAESATLTFYYVEI